MLTQKNGISKSQFSDVHNYLMHSSLFEIDKSVENDTLDISLIHTNYRITIEGINNFKDYCRNNTITDSKNTKFIEKSRIEDFDAIRVPDYDLYFKMRSEKNVENTNNVLSILKSHNKYFRKKKRFSFLHKNKSFRIDLTVVKTSEREAKTLQESGALQNLDKFEIEIEYLVGNNTSSDKNLEDLFGIIDSIKQLSLIHI